MVELRCVVLFQLWCLSPGGLMLQRKVPEWVGSLRHAGMLACCLRSRTRGSGGFLSDGMRCFESSLGESSRMRVRERRCLPTCLCLSNVGKDAQDSTHVVCC